MALDKGKDGITGEQERKAVDNIIHILDNVLFSYDCVNEADIEIDQDDQEFDDGIEQ
jgi:hypothetical protein